jgi:predicted nucleic acid-binding protein
MILTPDNEYGAVLDACVLVPMPLCDTLLRFAEEPALYRPFWSEQILSEVASALKNKLHLTDEQVARRLSRMREAFPESCIGVPSGMDKLFDCMPDGSDRHVLCAAVKAPAHAIVTLNKRHFPEDCLKSYGVLRHTPDEFLVNQYHLNPDIVKQKLDSQASAIHTERPVVLEKLLKVAPEFVNLVLRD